MSKPSKCLQFLLNRSQRIQPWRPMRNLEPTKHQMMLLNRMGARRWKARTIEEMVAEIRGLAKEIRMLKHARGCGRCLLELQLDVERYGGRRCVWYLDIMNDPTVICDDEDFEDIPWWKDAPRIQNYRIGSYWAGSSEDTVRFIKDRMRWAEKIMKDQIATATKFLRIVINWDLDLENWPDYPSKLLFFFLG